MKQFFKFMFASMLGTFLTLLVFFFIFIGMIASIASFTKESTPVIEAKSILHLKFDQPIYDRSPNMPFESIDFASFKTTKAFGLNDIHKADQQCSCRRTYCRHLSRSFQHSCIGSYCWRNQRFSLATFKESGKFIIAYGEVLTQSSYYLASVADKIYMNPEGYLDFKGLSASVMFYKGLLDKLELDMQVIRGKNNKFKSAVEPIIADKMSDANREQLNKLTEAVYGQK
jgi:protease IV